MTVCLKSHFYRPLFLTLKLKIFKILCSGGKIYEKGIRFFLMFDELAKIVFSVNALP